MFLKNHLEVLNFKDSFESYRCNLIVNSDASLTGYAGYVASTINGISHGFTRRFYEIFHKEKLTAVHRVLLSLIHILANQHIKWFTDNQGHRVKSIAAKGSMERELQDIAFNIFRICMFWSIYFEMEWIPRSENEDYFSRILDYDDWGISFSILDLIQFMLQDDWFASNYNSKLPKFYFVHVTG